MFLATCLVFILSYGVTSAQKKDTVSEGAKVIPIETTKYKKYIPPAPADKRLVADKTTSCYDNLGRLIMSFTAQPDGYIYIYLYDYDNNGNRIKYINLEVRQDRNNKDKFYLIKFNYTVSEYDKADALVSSKRHDLTEENLTEAIQKIADRLDQNK